MATPRSKTTFRPAAPQPTFEAVDAPRTPTGGSRSDLPAPGGRPSRPLIVSIIGILQVFNGMLLTVTALATGRDVVSNLLAAALAIALATGLLSGRRWGYWAFLSLSAVAAVVFIVLAAVDDLALYYVLGGLIAISALYMLRRHVRTYFGVGRAVA